MLSIYETGKLGVPRSLLTLWNGQNSEISEPGRKRIEIYLAIFSNIKNSVLQNNHDSATIVRHHQQFAIDHFL